MDDDRIDDDLAMEEVETAGGGILAIVLLIVAILLLVFLFRKELGFGTPTAEISIPDRPVVERDSSDAPPTDALENAQ